MNKKLEKIGSSILANRERKGGGKNLTVGWLLSFTAQQLIIALGHITTTLHSRKH